VQPIRGTYRNGALHLEEPVPLADGQAVMITFVASGEIERNQSWDKLMNF
jgi:hypothetical protein